MSKYNNERQIPREIEKVFISFLKDSSSDSIFLMMPRGSGKSTILKNLSKKYSIDIFDGFTSFKKIKSLNRDYSRRICLIDETPNTLTFEDRKYMMEILKEWFNYEKFFGLYTPNQENTGFRGYNEHNRRY